MSSTGDISSVSSAASSSSAIRLVVCILAAGYGTRLERDILNDQSKRFQHLVGVPKPLLPVNRQPLLTRWLKLLQDAGVAKSDIFVIGNQYNHKMLVDWANQTQMPESNLLNDGSTSNATRLGAVGDLNLLLRQLQFNPESNPFSLLIIGGDTLFYPDFDLSRFLEPFRSTSSNSTPASQLLYYTVEDTSKYGVIECDESNLVTGFLEKPAPSATTSRKASPCFYLLSSPALATVEPYVKAATDLSQIDAPGNLIKHIIQRNQQLQKASETASVIPIYAQSIKGRFDIGGLDSYIECEKWFEEYEGKREQ